MSKFLSPSRGARLLVLLWLLPGAAQAPAGELLPPGFRPLPLGVHALVGGKVVLRPGEALERGTIVIRDGFIQAVGKDVVAPPDARVWDMKGTTIYAGFIEPYLVTGTTNPPIETADSEPVTGAGFTSPGVKFFGAPGVQTDMGNPGPGYELAKITPEHRAVRDYSPKDKTLAPLRELGFTAAVIAPAKGIIRGTSALVALSEADPNEVVLKPDLFQHVSFETHRPGERDYPASLMGVIAAVRQSFFDAQHYALDHADYQRHPEGRKRPAFDPALEALGPAAGKRMRVVFEPGSALMVDRAGRLAAELGLDFCLVACGQEWRRPDLAKSTGTTFLVPLDFPAVPKLPNDDDWEQVSLDQLRAWDWAPENAALLRRQGLEIALTTYGLSDKKQFREHLRQALDRGLKETDALAALTTVPARLCGVENLLGAIAPGRLANLTVVAGDSYFDPETQVREVWIDGRIYRVPVAEPPAAAAAESKEKAESGGKPTSKAESARPKAEPEKHAQPPEAATRTPETKPGQPTPPPAKSESKKDKQKEQVRELQKTPVARSPLAGRGPLPLSRVDPVTGQSGPPDAAYAPENIVVRDATIWLCDDQGAIVTNGLLWVKNGKITGAGRIGLPSLPDLLVIDGHGLHVTPGLIDCHSHTAILGSVNESTLPSTAMVRIRDVVNSETPNLYQQLAGGVTTVHLLHGSANPIGGQDCVIKLRDGAAPEDLVFAAAPPGIKFALGENVKQSNWGETSNSRFPQTRMGVRTFFANRFTAAQQYLDQWEKYRRARPDSVRAPAVPPRRDLELEALAEILQSRRWIHCHAYRQDEMLMLLRLMEGFGVRIGTFDHALEGYKVADELAAHGAGATTFSDWWAYKFEVYDAIPYNASLMRQRGVLVSLNSDSSELARRLYAEAAKTVKYGGVPEAEALKFVTLNPAKQLRIEQRVGSLEPGKDADFVLWSKSPLDASTVCLQTWIEGRKYFDRSLDAQRTAALQEERTQLLAKAKKLARLSKGGDSGGGETAEAASRFFRTSLEHQYDGLARSCVNELRR